MFVPIGAFFAAVHPSLARFGIVLPLGLLLTTIIETTQLLMRNGQCDLEDLAANTVGALLGLLLYKLIRRAMPSRAYEE
jgi:glycopeptide antibiotics resistance protein